MADRVVVMNGGVIEQAGPPQELYYRPASQFVAGFIGSPSMNFLDATVVARGEEILVQLADGTELAVPPQQARLYLSHAGKRVTFGIRPESMSTHQDRVGFANIDAKVELVEPLGAATMIYFTIAGIGLCASVDPESGVRAGTTVQISLNMNHMHLFHPETGKSLHGPI